MSRANRIASVFMACASLTVACGEDPINPGQTPLHATLAVSGSLVTDTSAVTLTVTVSNPADTTVMVAAGTCPIAIVVIVDADTLVPAFEDGPPCWPAAEVAVAAGGAVSETRDWTGRVADWEFGTYPRDGIATLRLVSDAVLLDHSAVTTQLLIAPIARIEASITLDSVLLPWIPEDRGVFRLTLRNPGWNPIHLTLDSARACVPIEVRDPFGVEVPPLMFTASGPCAFTDSALVLAARDSLVGVVAWWGWIPRPDTTHPYSLAAASPPGTWSACVVLGGAGSPCRARLEFAMGPRAFDTLERRVRVATDSVAVGDTTRVWVGLHNTTQRPIRVRWGDLCIITSRFLRFDGVNVTSGWGCGGGSYSEWLAAGDSVTQTLLFQATSTRAQLGVYWIQAMVGWPHGPSFYTGDSVPLTVY